MKDTGTGSHGRRLATQAAALGAGLGLSTDEIRILEWAGYVHDIGKIGIPEEVLNKRGPLTPEEWDVMRRHAELGDGLLRRLPGLREVLPVVRHHHERWDGLGYPDGLSGGDIPYLARVFQHLDVFDALRGERAYKPALGTEEALLVMEGEVGTRLDPDVFESFGILAGDGLLDGWATTEGVDTIKNL